MDIYQVLGYLTGLVLFRPDIDPPTLIRTTALIHVLDGILCRVIAGHGSRPKNRWMAAGLIFGIWALAILFFLPEKQRKD
ncbi:MAG: hypothetical protein OEN50_12895 [Deltaproteobacteria bacterium]|nr:hypothetical protein [Deltaproteobacteria bacterium]